MKCEVKTEEVTKTVKVTKKVYTLDLTEEEARALWHFVNVLSRNDFARWSSMGHRIAVGDGDATIDEVICKGLSGTGPDSAKFLGDL